MKPELDGTGAGYGKFSGKTLGEIREIFERCEAEPTMRSASIVLRVAREQLEARGGLGHYPVYAAIAGAVFAASFVVKIFLPENVQSAVPKFQAAIGLVTVALLIGVFSTAGDRKRGLAQERAIIELSRGSLERIVSAPGFTAKPLDFTQTMTLKTLVAGAKDSPAASLLGHDRGAGVSSNA